MGYQIAVVDDVRYLILDAAIAVEFPPRGLVGLLVDGNSGQSQQDYVFIDEWGRSPFGWLDEKDAEALNGMAAAWRCCSARTCRRARHLVRSPSRRGESATAPQ